MDFISLKLNQVVDFRDYEVTVHEQWNEDPHLDQSYLLWRNNLDNTIKCSNHNEVQDRQFLRQCHQTAIRKINKEDKIMKCSNHMELQDRQLLWQCHKTAITKINKGGEKGAVDLSLNNESLNEPN